MKPIEREIIRLETLIDAKKLDNIRFKTICDSLKELLSLRSNNNLNLEDIDKARKNLVRIGTAVGELSELQGNAKYNNKHIDWRIINFFSEVFDKKIQDINQDPRAKLIQDFIENNLLSINDEFIKITQEDKKSLEIFQEQLALLQQQKVNLITNIDDDIKVINQLMTDINNIKDRENLNQLFHKIQEIIDNNRNKISYNVTQNLLDEYLANLQFYFDTKSSKDIKVGDADKDQAVKNKEEIEKREINDKASSIKEVILHLNNIQKKIFANQYPVKDNIDNLNKIRKCLEKISKKLSGKIDITEAEHQYNQKSIRLYISQILHEDKGSIVDKRYNNPDLLNFFNMLNNYDNYKDNNETIKKLIIENEFHLNKAKQIRDTVIFDSKSITDFSKIKDSCSNFTSNLTSLFEFDEKTNVYKENKSLSKLKKELSNKNGKKNHEKLKTDIVAKIVGIIKSIEYLENTLPIDKDIFDKFNKIKQYLESLKNDEQKFNEFVSNDKKHDIFVKEFGSSLFQDLKHFTDKIKPEKIKKQNSQNSNMLNFVCHIHEANELKLITNTINNLGDDAKVIKTANLIRSLSTLGEAGGHLSPHTIAQTKDAPWKPLTDVRNFIEHLTNNESGRNYLLYLIKNNKILQLQDFAKTLINQKDKFNDLYKQQLSIANCAQCDFIDLPSPYKNKLDNNIKVINFCNVALNEASNLADKIPEEQKKLNLASPNSITLFDIDSEEESSAYEAISCISLFINLINHYNNKTIDKDEKELIITMCGSLAKQLIMNIDFRDAIEKTNQDKILLKEFVFLQQSRGYISHANQQAQMLDLDAIIHNNIIGNLGKLETLMSSIVLDKIKDLIERSNDNLSDKEMILIKEELNKTRHGISSGYIANDVIKIKLQELETIINEKVGNKSIQQQAADPNLVRPHQNKIRNDPITSVLAQAKQNTIADDNISEENNSKSSYKK